MTVESKYRKIPMLKSGLAIGVALVLTAFAVAWVTVSQYRDAERASVVQDVARHFSGTLVHLQRFQNRLSAYEIDDGTIEPAQVRGEYAALLNEIAALEQSDYHRALKDRPNDVALIDDMVFAARQIAPVVNTIESEGAATAGRRQFELVEADLIRLSANLNKMVELQVETERASIFGFTRIFILALSILTMAIIVFVFICLRQTSLLGAARGGMSQLSADLESSFRQLEVAKSAVEAANIVLKKQNERLVEREADVRVNSRRFAAALENMREGISMFDADRRLVVSNRHFLDLYRVSPELAAVGTPHAELKARMVAGGLLTPTSATVLDELDESFEPRTQEFELTDGRVIEVHREPMNDGGWVTTHEDITLRRKSESHIGFLARHDALTGLENRVSFQEGLASLLGSGKADSGLYAVIIFDLDRFKTINDIYGYEAGDIVLCEISRRAAALSGDHGLASRCGGDEFGMVLGPFDSELQCRAAARSIVQTMSEPMGLEGISLQVGCCVGMAIAPLHGQDAETLIRRADVTLYQAKSAGRWQARIYDPNLDLRLQERRLLEADIRQALAQNKFELRYQPIIDLISERTVAVEALLRWHHPSLGWVSPDTFVPIAEDSGLIIPLGAWVLRQACLEASRWPKQVALSVNLSAAQLRSMTTVDTITEALHASRLHASQLELEMTETVLFDEERALEVMSELRGVGVRFSLDDFGTGYSSLSYLRRFQFDKIKIDKSFLREAETRPDCIAIINAIAGLGRSLKMNTVAEGIETATELDIVRAAGCRYGQGYLFGRPMSAEAILERLEGERALDGLIRVAEAYGRGEDARPSLDGARSKRLAG
jgi:diguanylate cyclase (GGDEF)-like protein